MDELRKLNTPPKLTIEDIDQYEHLKHLSAEEKNRLIDFVYELSLALFKIHGRTHDRHELL